MCLENRFPKICCFHTKTCHFYLIWGGVVDFVTCPYLQLLQISGIRQLKKHPTSSHVRHSVGSNHLFVIQLFPESRCPKEWWNGLGVFPFHYRVIIILSTQTMHYFFGEIPQIYQKNAANVWLSKMGNLYNHPCTNNGRLWWENATNKSLVARVVWFCSFSILYNSNLVPSLFVAEAFLSELEWEATLKCAKASLYMLNTKCTIKYGLNHTVDAKKLCTTWHVWNLTTNGINYQPQLVRRISKFLPSTAYWVETLHQDIHTYILYIYTVCIKYIIISEFLKQLGYFLVTLATVNPNANGTSTPRQTCSKPATQECDGVVESLTSKILMKYHSGYSGQGFSIYSCKTLERSLFGKRQWSLFGKRQCVLCKSINTRINI